MNRKKLIFGAVFIVLTFTVVNLQSFVGANAEEGERIDVPKVSKYNPVQEIENTIVQFDSILNENIKHSGNVGAAAVVTYKGRIALLKCFGVRKAGENNPVDKNTIFRLASVSKSVTGVLAGILDDENIVGLDDKIVDYIPDFSLKDEESTNKLTVRHLLSHTSGLIPHAYDLMVEDDVPLDQIIERLKEVAITAPPGELYGYQNVMYSIYDPVVKNKTHKSFNSLLETKVFKPFGMKDASTGFEAFKNNENKAYPHRNMGHNKFVPMRLNNHYYSTAPAAGVNASISDMGNFLAKLTTKDSKVISDDAKDAVFTPQVNSPLKRTYFRSWDKVQSKQYAIGWRIVDYKGRKVAYHGGYVFGYKAEIALCEEEEIGIAVLSNSPNAETAKNIPAFLNIFFEQKDALVLNEEREDPPDES